MVQAVDDTASSSRIEGEVRRAHALLKQHRFGESLEIAKMLEQVVPENRDVLYLIAVNQRRLGRIADALKALLRLEKIHPTFGRLFQERGHCYRSVGEVVAAATSYAQAVLLNGALVASWRALAELSSVLGQVNRAEDAYSRLAELQATPRELVHASGMLAEGDIQGADRVLRRFLQRHVKNVQAMRLLAQIGVKLGVLEEAEFLLESALAFEVSNDEARYEYALVLLQRHKYARALEEAEKLLQSEPFNRAFRTIQANARVGLGDHEEALRAFRELSAETPDNAEIHLSAGHALKTLGRREEAIGSYRAAAAARPDFGDAYWSLANLKTYRFDEEQTAQMVAHEADEGLTDVDRYHLCFAIGKAYEDKGEYEQSFRYYARGNALKRKECRYDADALERTLRRQIEVCTRELLASRQPCGSDRRDPIFIVGLPRAGSTLIEQILASHSQVEGTSELSEIPRLVFCGS
jgi:tetratricopeptide (TPR) repeat protein